MIHGDIGHTKGAPSILTESARTAMVRQLEAIWFGTSRLEMIVVATRQSGEERTFIVHWHAPCTDGEVDLSSVIVSMVDITDPIAADNALE
ncbi:MAG: hypothetical protein U9N84_13725 [Actinomycetota bacterium]|nr:hypothetical protein [Actinomycetota bacterium]